MAAAWQQRLPRRTIKRVDIDGEPFFIRRLPANHFALMDQFISGSTRAAAKKLGKRVEDLTDDEIEESMDRAPPSELIGVFAEMVWHCWTTEDGDRVAPATDEALAELKEQDPSFLMALGREACTHTMDGFRDLGGDDPGN